MLVLLGSDGAGDWLSRGMQGKHWVMPTYRAHLVDVRSSHETEGKA